jgi:hypothetical protein
MTQQERGFETGNQQPEQRTSELRAEIAETRERLAEDLGAISEKFSSQHAKGVAGEKARHAAERIKGTMRRAGHSTSAYARDNSLPLALLGMGLVGAGWLLVNARRSQRMPSYGEEAGWTSATSDHEYQGEPAFPSPGTAGEYGGEYGGVTEMRERTEHSGGLKRTIGNVKGRVGHYGHEAKLRAQSASHRAREQMSHQAHRAGDTMQHLMEDKPLLLGAAAFAAGIGLGMLLPTARQERRFLGPTRERLMHRAQDKLRAVKHVAERTAERTMDQVRETARETAREEAEREGLTQPQSTPPQSGPTGGFGGGGAEGF